MNPKKMSTIQIQSSEAATAAARYIITATATLLRENVDDTFTKYGPVALGDLLQMSDASEAALRFTAAFNGASRLPGTQIVADLLGSRVEQVAEAVAQMAVDPYFNDADIVLRALTETPEMGGAEAYALFRDIAMVDDNDCA